MIEIKHKDTGEVLHTVNDWTLKWETLSHLDLSYADFSHWNLSHANFSHSNLSHANFSHSDLRYADFSHSDLRYADFSHSDLTAAQLYGANFTGASLRYADLGTVELNNACLTDAILPQQPEPGLLLKVARAALAPDALNMGTWHAPCGTTHCIAGWACALTNTPLEKTHGTQVAGLLLLGAEAHSHFFDNNEDARAYLQSVIDNQGEQHAR